MKTKEITLKNCTTMYPVGENIQYYMKPTKEIAQHLMKNYSNKKQITLWCRGSSGAIIASLIANNLLLNDYKVIINHIKKEGESSHYSLVAFNSNDNHFIVDDFTHTGATIKAIYFKIIAASNNKISRVGLLLTGDCKLYTLDFTPSIIIAAFFRS